MARRALGKPPAYIARRAFQELNAEAERFFGPRRAQAFKGERLLARTNAPSIAELWNRLAARPYVAAMEPISKEAYESLCPGDRQRIVLAGERALAHRVNLLGSGEIDLGAEIDWHKDYKSGFRWPPQYCRDIDYMNPGRPSDVKFPWELSRQQWLIPCGQAWLLTGEERWAAGARRLIEDWIQANPYASSVNWSCTMEAALRVLTWTWLFHACWRSQAWADEGFRTRFLSSLYMHADFTDRHIEYADVNGNHCDADAAALVFAGLFFGGEYEPRRWLERGWKILCKELPRQVGEDGVDFEGSVAYHRLVTEFFFLPALYRERSGLEVPRNYRDRVTKMGWFTEAYTRPSGSAPVWGDADDARALPFGGQCINDHRYLLGWLGEGFGDTELARRFSGDPAECVWLLGLGKTRSLLARRKPSEPPRSVLFREGGYAVLRNERDHIFIDCGRVGTAGRGGHGHNDVLSFEAVLDGQHLITDCGAYVYTADYVARNAFRSTQYHNTPRVDEEEANRFVSPEDIWWLHDDAQPVVKQFDPGVDSDVIVIAHFGYERLDDPVIVVRSFRLNHESHSLVINDEVHAAKRHSVEVPLHFSAIVTLKPSAENVTAMCENKLFSVTAIHGGPWARSIEPTFVSRSYGRRCDSTKVVWRHEGAQLSLRVCIEPIKDRQ